MKTPYALHSSWLDIPKCDEFTTLFSKIIRSERSQWSKCAAAAAW
jgi:hypothetical protein